MRFWRTSFVTRLAVLFASLIIAVVLLSGWLRDRASRDYFLQDQRRHLANRAELMRTRLQTAVDAVRKDILYLSRAPAFARLAAAREGPEREAARRDAAQHFIAGLQVRPSYFQARLIGLADEGRELFRFDQLAGQIREAPESGLQREGRETYFAATTALPAGDFLFSDIRLNRSSGRIAEPHTPTLRAATPVFDETGRRFGTVEVSVDVTPWFEELRNLAGPDVVATLSNRDGDYLLHPERAKCFGFDLGRRFTLFDDHLQLRNGDRHARFEEGPQELSITDEFPFAQRPDQRLILRLALAKAPLLAPLQARRAQNFALTLALAALAGAVVMGVTRLFARNLRRVTEAVERYEPGKPLPSLPPETPDEIGLLTRKIRDMAEKISEQMHSLEESRQRAEAAMRAREEFMATMSHEIRTPMNAVLGLAHVLEAENQLPRQAERLRTLKFAGRHLMALLNNLLDRDRIEAGSLVFDRADFDLAELLENLRLSLEPLASRKGLALVLETGTEPPRRVNGDAVRLYQVLNNLAHNAIKFTKHGRVTVSVSCGPNEEVRFAIRDTGPGLPAPALESLRARSAPTAQSGLGLRISQRLIELLGGRLETECNAAGTSHTFCLRLPAAGVTDPTRGAEAPPLLQDYIGLVVEDVASSQMVLGALLEQTGMTVDFAITAAQARTKLAGGNYDLAFVDIQLPDANGAELAAEFREQQPHLRVLAVTAQVSPEIRAACQTAGVRAFVSKPIEPAELFAHLRRLTAPRIESLAELFDHNEAQVAEYLRQLDREAEGWAAELQVVLEAPDAERLRRLHHRMKNACGQLDLWKLDRTLTALPEATERGELAKMQELGATALRLIASVRQFTGANRFSTASR